MSLLCVTVRRAALVGNAGQFNTYVTLKLQNVKSTTVSVKGNNPSWEQDFIFETNRIDMGLIIEVWNKGMIWDKFLGTQWMPLTRVKYANEPEEGQWLSLDQELVIEDGEVVGTKVPTGHSLLLEAHFEVGCDELEDAELMKKIELLNVLLGQEISTVKEQERRHNLAQYSGVSEDSDYTSDVSYPTVQHPSASVHHPNSSASQFGGAAEISRRASEYSPVRDGGNARYIEPANSYDTDYRYSGTPVRENSDYDRSYGTEDPLYYNSRPNHRMNSRSTDRSRSTRSTSGYNNSLSLESDIRYSFETDRTDRSSRHCHWSEDTIDSETDKVNLERFQRSDRRRSLERQTGFDESLHDFIEHRNQSNQSSYDYHDSTEYPQSSFDSYQSYREDSVVSTDWEKGSRYTPTQDSFYGEWAENGEPPPPPSHHRAAAAANGTANKYAAPDERTDWSKVNGTVAGGGKSNVRQKPEPDEWRNDSTGSDWKKSVESDWSRDSPKSEWGQDTPVAKEPPTRGGWSEDAVITPKIERTPAEMVAKGGDKWGASHAPEHPKEHVDRWNGKQPQQPVEPVAAKPVDHWNGHKAEPAKAVVERRNSSHPTAKTADQWGNHVPEIPKVNDRWTDHPKETTTKNGADRWNGHAKETTSSKNGVDRWNGHAAKEAVKNGGDRWNGHAAEVVSKNGDRWNGHAKEPTKNGDRWNEHPKETPQKGSDRWNGHPSDAAALKNSWSETAESSKEDHDWLMNNSSVDTVKNAETWKNHEPMKNGWSEETIVQEWDEEPMTDRQIDSLINEWQEDNERNDEWMPEEEEEEEDIDIQLSKTEFPDESEPIDEMEPLDYKPPPRDSIDFSGNLTVNNKDLDVTRDRRPSVLSTKGAAPSLESSNIVSELLLPRTDVPEPLTIDDGDPNMSRAKRRWINAFNKIVAQLNEVRRMLFHCCSLKVYDSVFYLSMLFVVSASRETTDRFHK